MWTEEAEVLGMLAWVVEQACRFADAQVCALANLTDDVETVD